MKYNCNVCDFMTTNKYDFTRHSATNKHIRKIKENKQKKKDEGSKNKKNPTIPKHYCGYCDQSFMQKSNIDRHNKRFHVKQNEDIEHEKLNKMIDDRIDDKIKHISNNALRHLNCTYCNMKCSKPSNKTRHENKCSQKKIQELEATIERYDDYIDQLKKDNVNKNKIRNRNGHRISAPLRTKIWNTYIGEHVGKSKCPCCKEINITQLNFDCGHIKSVNNDGKTNVNNIIPICGICNKSMGDQHLITFMEDNDFGDLPFEINCDT
jgi:hypothetical protein